MRSIMIRALSRGTFPTFARKSDRILSVPTVTGGIVFRAIKHSLITRVSLASLATVALTIILTGWAVFWLFNQSAQRILDNHLMAYTDIILSRVEIDHDNVVLRDDAKLLAGLP